jgi:hypothetical protein
MKTEATFSSETFVLVLTFQCIQRYNAEAHDMNFNCDYFVMQSLLPSTLWFLDGQHNTKNIVAYLLKAGTVEPDKQPLLANGSETTFVSRQRPRNKQWNDVRC